MKSSPSHFSLAAWNRIGALLTIACILSLTATSCHETTPSSDFTRLTELTKEITDEMSVTTEKTANLAKSVSDLYPHLAQNAATADRSQYKLEPNGVLHRPNARSKDLPAVFVSGFVPVNDHVMEVVLGTEALDPILTKVVTESATTVQAYYNDKHSLNRIYPPFDVLTQYPPAMDIPSYNFYYLADTEHNPERKVKWIKEPYVDPAGRGWMISCIAPVFHRDHLEGVCGLDITVNSLVRNFDFEERNKDLLLVSSEGTIIATGEHLIRLLQMPALKNHRYVDTVRADTFLSDEYNILKSRIQSVRDTARSMILEHSRQTTLLLADKNWAIRSAPIPELDWLLLQFSPSS